MHAYKQGGRAKRSDSPLSRAQFRAQSQDSGTMTWAEGRHLTKPPRHPVASSLKLDFVSYSFSGFT